MGPFCNEIKQFFFTVNSYNKVKQEYFSVIYLLFQLVSTRPKGSMVSTNVVIYILELPTALLIFQIASLVIQEFMLTLKAILNC